MCIDFLDLNPVTLKDEYPLLVANMLINLALGHVIVRLMYGNARYNQVYFAKYDTLKIAFHCLGAMGKFE